MNRRTIRRRVLEALYAADRTGELDVADLGSKAHQLASRIWESRAELDVAIDRTSNRWRVERMPAVDRSIVRMGLYELLETTVPTAVVLDEAVRLAKEYSTERSGAFVNGILGRLASELSGTDPGAS